MEGRRREILGVVAIPLRAKAPHTKVEKILGVVAIPPTRKHRTQRLRLKFVMRREWKDGGQELERSGVVLR